jgi:ATP adenylyltransferase
MEYIEGHKGGGCIFCELAASSQDEANFVLLRGERALVVLNRYPYTNGHLLIAPLRHIGDLSLLNPSESQEIFNHLNRSIKALRDRLQAQGFNIGLNLGQVAGAGVESHLHIHLVPRWSGDTNFMPVLAQTKVIAEYLEETYRRLLPGFSI